MIRTTTVESPDPQQFELITDQLFERTESFVLVARLGPDVPEEYACFTTGFSNQACYGRTGATKIDIGDADGKDIVGS